MCKHDSTHCGAEWLVLLDILRIAVQEVEEVEAVSKGEDAKNGLSMTTEKSFAFGAARKPGSPPTTADSVTSLHPWTGRSNGGSYSPRSTSPPTGSPAPSEADLAQERAPAGGLLQAHMFEVGRQLACHTITKLNTLPAVG